MTAAGKFVCGHYEGFCAGAQAWAARRAGRFTSSPWNRPAKRFPWRNLHLIRLTSGAAII